MTAPVLAKDGSWIRATLHQGRSVQPPPGLSSGEDTAIAISVDHIVALTDHHYRDDDGERACCTNLLLATGAWITVCGGVDEFATLLGLEAGK